GYACAGRVGGPPPAGRRRVGGPARPPAPRWPGTPAARPGSSRRRVDLVLVEQLLPEARDVWTAELLAVEIDREERLQLLPVPAVRLQELLVVVALLVPIGEQRRREVDAP